MKLGGYEYSHECQSKEFWIFLSLPGTINRLQSNGRIPSFAVQKHFELPVMYYFHPISV